MTQIPEQMTAVLLESYEGATGLRVVQRPVPQPGPQDVLIQVAAAPINPSDLSFLQGRYGFQKTLPTIPGFEGSGTVVAVGRETGLMGRFLLGRRVACVTQQHGEGLWAEYAVTSVNYALPLAGAVSLEQGAMSVVNPLTAVALIDSAKKGGHKAVLNTAGASALGLMLHRLGQQEGIEVINIVRQAEQVTQLKQQGMRTVLNSSSATFAEELSDLCHGQKIRLAFDAIAGETPQRLLAAMPDHSRVTVYGNLAQKDVALNPGGLIFQDKSVDGFWLTRWVGQKNFLQSLLMWRRAQTLLLSALKTEVRARYPLAQAPQAVAEYEAAMSGGKVLLVMGE
ncbi:MAG: zinc-binding dehydrogenase [Ardenticatenaceae bacterium]|nr:zinc-binding dehydrogenase [Ardenticatenaceae bacterium]